MVAVNYVGEELWSYFHAPWEKRVDLAWQLMEIAEQLTNNDFEFALYLLDVSFDNFAVGSRDGKVIIVDAENVLVADKRLIRQSEYVPFRFVFARTLSASESGFSTKWTFAVPRGAARQPSSAGVGDRAPACHTGSPRTGGNAPWTGACTPRGGSFLCRAHPLEHGSHRRVPARGDGGRDASARLPFLCAVGRGAVRTAARPSALPVRPPSSPRSLEGDLCALSAQGGRGLAVLSPRGPPLSPPTASARSGSCFPSVRSMASSAPSALRTPSRQVPT